MNKIQVFVSYDTTHDRELFDQLLDESQAPGSSFEVAGSSEQLSTPETWRGRARRRIRDSDQMIVICGEHSDASTWMGFELEIAQEEKTPYFLLWGRREQMCTKPAGAKTSEGMFSWTRPILQNQIRLTRRNAKDEMVVERTAATAKA